MAVDIRDIEKEKEFLRENAYRLHCFAEEQYGRLRQCEDVIRMCNDKLCQFDHKFEAEFEELMAAFEELMATRYKFYRVAEGIYQYANALQNFIDNRYIVICPRELDSIAASLAIDQERLRLESLIFNDPQVPLTEDPSQEKL